MPMMERYPGGADVMGQEQKAPEQQATPDQGMAEIKAAVQTVMGFVQMLASKGQPGGQEAMGHLQALIKSLSGGPQGQPAQPAQPQAAPQAPAAQAGPRPMMGGGQRPMNAPIQ